MRIVAALGTAAAGALAIAALAVAKPPQDHHAHPVTAQKCVAHESGYRTAGTLVSWNATSAGTGGYTGRITVHVTRANRHAQGAEGTIVTYTLTDAHAVLGKRADPPVMGDRVTVIGKIAEVAKKCSDSTGAGTVTVRKVIVHAP
jgi:hypothetical protein